MILLLFLGISDNFAVENVMLSKIAYNYFIALEPKNRHQVSVAFSTLMRCACTALKNASSKMSKSEETFEIIRCSVVDLATQTRTSELDYSINGFMVFREGEIDEDM